MINGLEGGCLATNNDDLASRIRTARNFHVTESFKKVPLRINGKMSEAQAAMVLLALKNIDRNLEHNATIFETYRKKCEQMSGIKILKPFAESKSNYQHVVLKVLPSQIALSRNQFLDILKAENIGVKKYF